MRARFAAAAFVLMTTPVATPGAAQQPAPATVRQLDPSGPVLELSAASGMTIASIQWPGLIYAPSDQSTLNLGVAGKLLLPITHTVQLGIEAGHQRHYWYEYSGGYGVGNVRRSASSTQVVGLVRVLTGTRLTADLGAGIHVFDNSDLRFGALLGLTYHLPLGDRLDLPIGARLTPIFADQVLVPVVVTVGLGVPLGTRRLFARRPAAGPAPLGGVGYTRATSDTMAWVALPVVDAMAMPAVAYMTGKRVEITCGAGYVALAGEPVGDVALDVRVLYPVGGVGAVGVDVGRHYMDGTEDWLDHVAAVWRIQLTSRLDVDVGPELHFGHGAYGGALGEVLIHFPVSSGVDVPFGLRADALYPHPTVVMLSIAVGVGMRI